MKTKFFTRFSPFIADTVSHFAFITENIAYTTTACNSFAFFFISPAFLYIISIFPHVFLSLALFLFLFSLLSISKYRVYFPELATTKALLPNDDTAIYRLLFCFLLFFCTFFMIVIIWDRFFHTRAVFLVCCVAFLFLKFEFM